MTEWSLQLIRARHDMQRQQQQQQQQQQSTSSSDADWTARPSSSSGRQHSANLSSFPRSDQFSAPGAVLSAPYATEGSRTSTRGPLYGVPQSLNSRNGGGGSESEAIWRRISDAIVQNLDKLSRIFSKMDIVCSGSVSREEFELGMNHIGVFLTPREYEKAYDSLSPDLKDFATDRTAAIGVDDSKRGFGIKYADFLALFHGQSPLVLPTTSKHVSPPVAGMGNARLWDFLVQSIDKLTPLFMQLERINQRYVTPDTFRDCLARCGLAFSNADFAALRVRLLPFTYAVDCSEQRHSTVSSRLSELTRTMFSLSLALRHSQRLGDRIDRPHAADASAPSERPQRYEDVGVFVSDYDAVGSLSRHFANSDRATHELPDRSRQLQPPTAPERAAELCTAPSRQVERAAVRSLSQSVVGSACGTENGVQALMS